MQYNLGFIDDNNIRTHVLNTIEKYRFFIDLKTFKKNLIDPIKLNFDSKIYNKPLKKIIENEVMRQIDKSNTNHIGYFHQNIFKYIGKGWIIPDKGYDLINENKKIFVEMKNKHNTMNSSSSQKIYAYMQRTLKKNHQATCLLVEVITNNSQNIAWKIKLNGKVTVNEKIRRLSIDKFYELVTEDKLAFKKLCEAIPKVINEVMPKTSKNQIKNSVFAEISAISPNLMKSIYLLSFANYQGFTDFKI